MMGDRELWLTVRRGLFLIIAAFDQKYDVKGKGRPDLAEEDTSPLEKEVRRAAPS